jgi:hypothetical protein
LSTEVLALQVGEGQDQIWFKRDDLLDIGRYER